MSNGIINKPSTFVEEFELSSNGTIYLNHGAIVLIYSDRGGMWTEGVASRVLKEISADSYITVTRQASNKLKLTNNGSYNVRVAAISSAFITFTTS